MRVLQRTLAILAFLALSAQIVRHAYILWFEPKGSVLDRYEQPLKGQITNAKSLQELISQYEPIRNPGRGEGSLSRPCLGGSFCIVCGARLESQG